MKKVCLYCRVSTTHQTSENQLRELRAVVQRMGYEIVSEFIDNGISGAKSRKDRPALDEMMKLEENMKYEQTEDDKMIEEAFGEIEEPGDSCSTKNLTVQNNVVCIKYTDMGGDNDYNPGFM